MRCTTCATSSAFGFSDDTSEFMNSKLRTSRDRDGACTLTPSKPTTTWSPAFTRCIAIVRTAASVTTMPQSISGFSTERQWPSTRTSVARFVVE